MRCRTCDYSLFNLTTRSCPECGAAFRPSEYTFLPNAVRFCCPHCDQVYYGTDASGHLVPREYECISCAARIEMDAMVLRPAEGVSDRQTIAGSLPWLDRKGRNVLGAWLRTVGGAMVRPLTLARGMPECGGTGEAWWFAIFTFILIYFCGAVVPMVVFTLINVARGGNDMDELVRAGSIMFFAGIAGCVVIAALWALTTHAVLRLTGGAPARLGRTFQAILYSSAANVPSAFPCLGLYPFFFVGPTWWIVSAAIMMQQVHRMRGARAVWATLVFPVIAVLLVVGSFVGLMFFSVSQATRIMAAQSNVMQMPVATQTQATAVLESLRAHGEATGQWPVHAAELSADLPLSSFSLFDDGSVLEAQLDGTEFGAFDVLSTDEQRAIVERVAASQPTNVVAHRVGDFVFTYHGSDPYTADARLWLFVVSPDPEGMAAPGMLPFGAFAVGRANGAIENIEAGEMLPELERQNRLRRRSGFAELPPPWTVTTDSPALKE